MRSALRGAGLVLVGGTLGSWARYAVTLVVPSAGHWPVATLAVNVGGAFLLALLVRRLGGAASAAAHRLRLLLGTGMLGGFTTYSSFALEVDRLLADGAVGTAVGYLAATLVGGLAAASAGYALAGAGQSGAGQGGAVLGSGGGDR